MHVSYDSLPPQVFISKLRAFVEMNSPHGFHVSLVWRDASVGLPPPMRSEEETIEEETVEEETVGLSLPTVRSEKTVGTKETVGLPPVGCNKKKTRPPRMTSRTTPSE